MFRPPFMARVAAGAAVYAIEETRRLPTAAMHFPITAISQMLQTTMHIQQFITSLALKGDAVFEHFSDHPVEQPEWATFDEDLADKPDSGPRATSRFDQHTADDATAATTKESPLASAPFTAESSIRSAETNGHTRHEPEAAEPEPDIAEPEIATRYNYATMTLAQLRARLRMLTLEDLEALLEYEQRTRARAPFVTMLTNRIATVQAQ
ncbi:lipid droplet-associated protein [Nocardia sp. 004]|uniref:lipid droplet-associated protein n=1 Tax=Nocardia sp. 004 TaxID=3385978 RepID=UPI0039A15E01